MHFCPQVREEPDAAQHFYEDPDIHHLEQVCQWEEDEAEEDSPGMLMLASKVKELQANVAEYRVSWTPLACPPGMALSSFHSMSGSFSVLVFYLCFSV